MRLRSGQEVADLDIVFTGVWRRTPDAHHPLHQGHRRSQKDRCVRGNKVTSMRLSLDDLDHLGLSDT